MNYIENLLRAYLPGFIVKLILPDVVTILGTFDKLEAKLQKHVQRQNKAIARNLAVAANLQLDTEARQDDTLRALRVANNIKQLTA